MRQQRVIWDHDFHDEPTVLWSEVGDDRLERRKVDEYGDGRLDYADAQGGTGSTLVGDQPMPSLDEINASTEFTGVPISSVEFEAVWRRATRG